LTPGAPNKERLTDLAAAAGEKPKRQKTRKSNTDKKDEMSTPKSF